MHRNVATPYFEELEQRIAELGGIFNAHLHLDRAGTYHETVRMLEERGVRDGSILSLAGKHALIPMVHASKCYDPPELERRVDGYLQKMIAVGTRRADTVVDVTVDEVGLSALDTFLGLKERHHPQFDLRVGAYSPLGFRDDEPGRWALLETGAARADFIGLLPERDDTASYPDHIGFAESCRRAIRLAQETGKQLHIHVDQANHRHEDGAEIVVEVMRELDAGTAAPDEPFVWLIHLISPSTYEEPRFEALIGELAALNIGVICCPSAALSMRQYRKLQSPTFNSIARVLELVAGGVHVRLGSDNICDITSPMGTADLMDELFALANAIRFYDTDILAKLAAGQRLGEAERARIGVHLAEDADIANAVVARLQPLA